MLMPDPNQRGREREGAREGGSEREKAREGGSERERRERERRERRERRKRERREGRGEGEGGKGRSTNAASICSRGLGTAVTGSQRGVAWASAWEHGPLLAQS